MIKLNFNKDIYLKYLPIFLIICLYLPVYILHFTQNWTNPDNQHAYFVLPVFLWLTWRQRELFKKSNKTFSFSHDIISLFFLIFGSLLFFHGWRNNYILLCSFSLIPVLAGYIGLSFGLTVLRSFWFPLFYLILQIPPSTGILDNITITLRYIITHLVETILSLMGYLVTSEGLVLSINNQQIYMGAPCSGFRSLISLLSLGLVYIYISTGNILTKSLLVLSIIPLALLGNFIRVTSVCVTAAHFGHVAAGTVHDILGYIIFLILIIGLITLENVCLRLEKNAL